MAFFNIEFTEEADFQLKTLEEDASKKGLTKQVKKTIGFLQTNPRHPSLNTHPYGSIPNPINSKDKVFEAYAQNRTPAAYRVFWIYGSAKHPPTSGKTITIISITSHP